MVAERRHDTVPLKRVLPAPHRFTVDEYHKMAEIGVLTEDSRVELIDGEIVKMPPIGPEHVGNVNWFTRVFGPALGGRGQLSIQNPVQLGLRVEPQPDVVVLRPRADDYRKALPAPDDVLLLIEIAGSSLTYDRKTKARLYARAGIADYWIVNLVDSVVEVYRNPVRSRYRSVEALKPGDVIRPLAFPDVAIAVSDILGEES
jgi:Uma2 family endonuclease